MPGVDCPLRCNGEQQLRHGDGAIFAEQAAQLRQDLGARRIDAEHRARHRHCASSNGAMENGV